MSTHGYYVYPSNGYSYWGVGLFRGGNELPRLVEKKVHQASKAAKIRYCRMLQYREDKAKAKAAAAEAEAKAKAAAAKARK